jgi:hypothetical protein
MEIALSLIVGIGLSAACGFRVFVPLLGMSIAAMSGHLHLAPGFAWIATWPALIAFSVATVLEIGAYCIPWVDHLLDAVTTPAAIVAGTIMTASVVDGDLSPMLRWSMAAIAGGGVAGLVQLGTVVVRGASSAATGGLGNFFVSLIELAGAALMTVIAMLFPAVCVIVVLMLAIVMIRKLLAAPGSGKITPNAVP